MRSSATISSFKPLLGLAVGVLLFAWGGLSLKDVAIAGPPIAAYGLVFALVALMLYYARRNEETLAAALGATLFLIVFTLGGGLLSYLLMSRPEPLLDARFAALDAALGFDWLATLRAVDERPWLAALLRYAYDAEIPVVVFIMLFLLAVRRQDRVVEFCWLFALAGLSTIVISGLMPAEGAYVFHAPPPEMRAGIPADSGLWHLKHLHALRDGTMRLIDVRAIEGLVTFPSFHTALAIVFAIVLRGMAAAFWPMAVYAALVVASTVPIGGHYFIDVIAGALIAFAAAPLAQWLARRGLMGNAGAATVAPA